MEFRNLNVFCNGMIVIVDFAMSFFVVVSVVVVIVGVKSENEG